MNVLKIQITVTSEQSVTTQMEGSRALVRQVTQEMEQTVKVSLSKICMHNIITHTTCCEYKLRSTMIAKHVDPIHCACISTVPKLLQKMVIYLISYMSKSKFMYCVV